MTISHTPGPWFAVESEHFWTIRIRAEHCAPAVADTCASKFLGEQDNNPVAEANAHLIAASPSLYEALRLASIALSQVPTSAGIDGLVHEALARARAALTLAEGR